MSAGASYFCFPHDIADVGVDVFCDELLDLGVTGVTVAAHYHASRDARPRAAIRGGASVLDLAPGASYFPARAARYPDSMKPWTPAPFDRDDLLAALGEATSKRGMSSRPGPSSDSMSAWGAPTRLSHRRTCSGIG